jgi:phosphoglycerate dehydrogenase-like enzyme
MRILVSDTIARDYGREIASIVPDAAIIELRDDGSVTDAAPPDVVFISNDVFYGPVKACMQIVLDTPQLAWLQSAAAGVEAPAFRAHLERGGRLTNAHVTAVPIAEYVMWAVLGTFQEPQRLADQRAAKIWQHVPFREVWRTTWLVVGLGSIGREVAKRARAFDARVIGVRRRPDGTEPVDEILTPDRLTEVIGRADVVVIAAELNDANRHLVDDRFLSAMKHGSCFVNVARGGLVDESALLAALDRDAPAHAVLDVFEAEPLPADSVWWTHPKVTMSPHSSGGGNGRIVRAVEVFLDNLQRYRDRRPLVHEITLADLPAQPTVWHVEKR